VRSLDILVIHRSLYDGQEIVDALGEDGHQVEGVYRTYHADALLAAGNLDVVIGNGTCKDRDPDRGSFPVYYPSMLNTMIKVPEALYLSARLPIPALRFACNSLARAKDLLHLEDRNMEHAQSSQNP
jgi:hypothetical protein